MRRDLVMGLLHFVRGTSPSGELFSNLVGLTTDMTLAIGLAEAEGQPFSKAVATRALKIVTCVPFGPQTIGRLLDRIKAEGNSPAACLADGISVSFISASVLLLDNCGKYGDKVRKDAAVLMQLARMEGTLLGFIERQGLRAWTATWRLPKITGNYITDFENARTLFGTGVRHFPDC